MDTDKTPDITRILNEWKDGNEEAKERLLRFVYDELKRRARILMSNERRNHTLQPTELVHEAFMRLNDSSALDWKDRKHFYGIVSRLMRQVLVDHARSRSAARRGSNSIHFSTDDFQIPITERAASIVALDDALEKLEAFDERQARIVEMRFFGGFSNKEISEVIGVSLRTINREWQYAKLWLFRELKRG